MDYESVADITCRIAGTSKRHTLPEAKFASDLGVDSLDMVEIVVELESVYGILIPELYLDDAQQRTVGEVQQYVDELARNKKA